MKRTKLGDRVDPTTNSFEVLTMEKKSGWLLVCTGTSHLVQSDA